MIKRIYVDRHKIAHNKKHDDNEPVITVRTYKGTRKAHEATIFDHDGNVVARVIYRPNKPLSCGATVWIETYSAVEAVDLNTGNIYSPGNEANNITHDNE